MKISQIIGKLDEVSLGNYQQKAQKAKALAQMGAMFGGDPEQRAKDLATFKKREKGLGMAKVRSDKAAAQAAAQRKAEYEQGIKDKYAGVDIDAEIAKLKPAMKRAYDDYQYGASNTYSDARDEYQRLQGKIQELERAKQILGGTQEFASAGSTSASAVPSAHGKRSDTIVV